MFEQSSINRFLRTLILSIMVGISCLSLSVQAAGVKTIAIYKIVPGKQLEFIQWMAEWDKVYHEIGLEQPVWYRSIKGADWDFVVIYPPFDNAKEMEMEKVGKQRGLEIGFQWKLKFWEFMSSNTSTLALGPITPAELLESLQTK